jgi:DNA-binding transcriptional ArsR family regulator
VTDLLSDKEPLKWTLRDKAIDIYSNLINNKNIDFSMIISILDLFSQESSISNLNYDILKKEYKNLKSFIEENKESIIPEQGFILDFSTRPPAPTVPSGQAKSGAVGHPIGHIGHNSRKEKILEFLNQGPKTISEIAPLFQEISEKSIQRDLIDLKRLGKVATEGEKRWRKYKLELSTS